MLNLKLFELAHINGDDIYSHANTFSDEVYSAGSTKNSYKIDDYILKMMRNYINDIRIEQIRQNRNFGELIKSEDAEQLSYILNFYKIPKHTKNEIEILISYFNNLLDMYSNSNANARTRNTALAFIYSLSSIRAKEKSQAEYLFGTKTTLYKGHDIGAESSEYVKNMDIGGSCYIKKPGGKATDYYLGKNNKIISLRASEINEAIDYLEEHFPNKIFIAENSTYNFDSNNKSNEEKYNDSVIRGHLRKRHTHGLKKQPNIINNQKIEKEIILPTEDENKPKIIRHISRAKNFVDMFNKEGSNRHRHVAIENNSINSIDI